MIKLLGILDILASLTLFIAVFNIPFPKNIAIIFSAYLLIKGILFIKNIVSAIDILSGVVLLLSLNIDLPMAVVIITAFLLLQKGIFSMLSH